MIKNLYKGKFIVFEGLDGSGLSTQAGLLRDFLIKEGFKVILTKEPTLDSRAGKEIRKILDYYPPSTHPKKEFQENLQKLFAQDRKEHLKKVITPALKKGKIVISDRYFFSSLAYGAGSGVNLDWLIKLNDEFLLPDLTFILKVSPKICLQRIKKRNEKRTFFEEEEKLTKVFEVYKTLPNRFKNVYLIDGKKPIEDVFEKVKSLVLLKLKNKK